MSYDSRSLTTPDIKWLGVRPSDLDRYQIPDQCRTSSFRQKESCLCVLIYHFSSGLDMTERDIKTGKELLKEDFIKKNPEWHNELQLMVKMKKKAEIRT